MEKISLYIAGKKVDLDNNSFILFNYTMEDLSNPTIVKNSFSKQITLKGTPANNEIFGNLYRADRRTIFGEGYTGVAFDPLRKTPFSIYNEMNEIIESGYVKVDSVDKISEVYEYKVTLYGGLGSFFYGLSYNDDGTKKSLSDLRYQLINGGYAKEVGAFGQIGGYQMLLDCWSYLELQEDYRWEEHDCLWANVVNFAPAYNGLPESFSADKALVTEESYANMPMMSAKEGATSNLMIMANQHTEWEMKELRWYLQRPIFSINSLFKAVSDQENNGGWVVNYASVENLFKDLWVTLPLIPSAERANPNAIVKLMSSTSSPADIIISIAKIHGLVFLCDSGSKQITIMSRSQFFADNEVVDLSNRIDAENITMTPLLAQSRYYQFGGSAVGEWAKTYKEEYGRDYGIQMVNTGNEFNKEISVLTKDILFKDAVEVQERNLLYVTEFVRGEGTEVFRLPQYERVFVQSWNAESMTEADVPYEGRDAAYADNPYYRLADWLPKVQIHEEKGKTIDGANILLLFNGMYSTPEWVDWAIVRYRLTDDHPDMGLLNEGLPCWNLTDQNSYLITKLPSFRRNQTQKEGEGEERVVKSLEWGKPLARGVYGLQESEEASTLYERMWKQYQSDRYDVDTRVMRCKVNLSGMQVGQNLMRNFFFYENAIWVLNKISNYSMTTNDLTECEFVKVKDIKNYTQGQKL